MIAWFRRLLARCSWTTVRATTLYRYQVNGIGERRIVQVRAEGWQPIDRHWLATGEWSEHARRAA